MQPRANQQVKTTASTRAKSHTPQEARGNGHRIEDRRAQHPLRRKDDAKPALQVKGPTIGAFVTGLLQKGKSTEAILRAVFKKFLQAHTSAASVAWYRSKLNK